MDKEEFITFLKTLREDLKKNPENWENNTLDTFLEAMHAYTVDIQGFYNNTNQKVDSNKPSWKTFSDILKGAKSYE